MSSQYFEFGRSPTVEIDLAEDMPDFSVETSRRIRNMRCKTLVMEGIFFHNLLSEQTFREINQRFSKQGFDLTNIKSIRSEVAILKPLFLDESYCQTVEEENTIMPKLEHHLRYVRGLDVGVYQGNIADSLFIMKYLAVQRMFPRGLDYFVRTSTTNDGVYGGTDNLIIKYNGKVENGPDKQPDFEFALESMPISETRTYARVVPILVPDRL